MITGLTAVRKKSKDKAMFGDIAQFKPIYKLFMFYYKKYIYQKIVKYVLDMETLLGLLLSRMTFVSSLHIYTLNFKTKLSFDRHNLFAIYLKSCRKDCTNFSSSGVLTKLGMIFSSVKNLVCFKSILVSKRSTASSAFVSRI